MYEGSFSRGIPRGYGRMISKGSIGYSVWEGEFMNIVPYGYGKMSIFNGGKLDVKIAQK